MRQSQANSLASVICEICGLPLIFGFCKTSVAAAPRWGIRGIPWEFGQNCDIFENTVAPLEKSANLCVPAEKS
jgi:hypothetical protein